MVRRSRFGRGRQFAYIARVLEVIEQAFGVHLRFHLSGIHHARAIDKDIADGAAADNPAWRLPCPLCLSPPPSDRGERPLHPRTAVSQRRPPRNLVLATKPFMQRHHEAEIGLLAPGEVFLEPSGLLAPKSLFRGIAGRSVAEIAVENDEVLPDGRGGWKINFAGTPLFSQTNRCILIDTEVTA
jgi:hypothetical protein